VKLDEHRFASLALGSVELLAVCHPSTPVGPRTTMEVARLAEFPLLLMDSGFGFRRSFDAASRMAGLKPTIKFESRNPHTLLALAEAGHGVAIIPSPLPCPPHDPPIALLPHPRRPLPPPVTTSLVHAPPLPPF